MSQVSLKVPFLGKELAGPVIALAPNTRTLWI